jgi:hypothetical protein
VWVGTNTAARIDRQDEVIPDGSPFPEGLVDLTEAVQWNLGEYFVEKLGVLFSYAKQLTLIVTVGLLKPN